MMGDTRDLQAEMERYAALLRESPVDLSFVRFGENGHIAFNDPHAADFSNSLIVKRVELKSASRRQQVGEGHFSSLDDVPREALTLTCTGLTLGRNWIDLQRSGSAEGSGGAVRSERPGFYSVPGVAGAPPSACALVSGPELGFPSLCQAPGRTPVKITGIDVFILHAPVTGGRIGDSTHQLTHWGAPGSFCTRTRD
jgi:hypothetical protein